MKITCINDLVNITDEFGKDITMDPYMFQSCEIQSYRDNAHQLYIRYGITTSDAGFSDCFCINATYKTRRDAEDDKNALINALTIAKCNRDKCYQRGRI